MNITNLTNNLGSICSNKPNPTRVFITYYCEYTQFVQDHLRSRENKRKRGERSKPQVNQIGTVRYF